MTKARRGDKRDTDMKNNNWMIDSTINLTEEAEKAEWHEATLINRLMTEGLERNDAEAFTDFIFSEKANARDCKPEECVTENQWERLTLN